MEYDEIITRLNYIKIQLDGEMRKFVDGQLKQDAIRDIQALDNAINIAKESRQLRAMVSQPFMR